MLSGRIARWVTRRALQRLQHQGGGAQHAVQQLVLAPGPQRGGERRAGRGGRHHEPGRLALRPVRRAVRQRRQQPFLGPAGQRVQRHRPRRRAGKGLHRHQPAAPGRAAVGNGKRRQPAAGARQRPRGIDGIGAADQLAGIIRGRGSGHGLASDTSAGILRPPRVTGVRTPGRCPGTHQGQSPRNLTPCWPCSGARLPNRSFIC